jgi:phospholipase/carboxylesterase
VLVTAGRRDPICPPQLTGELVDWLTAQGIATTVEWHDGGHELRQNEIDAACLFLSGLDE